LKIKKIQSVSYLGFKKKKILKFYNPLPQESVIQRKHKVGIYSKTRKKLYSKLENLTKLEFVFGNQKKFYHFSFEIFK